MAQITMLYKKNSNKPVGCLIHDMLMPDGSKRAYKAMGKNAIESIINKYRNECRRMLNAMLWTEVACNQ